MQGAPGRYPCYITTRHWYSDSLHGCCPYLSDYEYSSTEASHDSFNCWYYPNCVVPPGGGGGGGR